MAHMIVCIDHRHTRQGLNFKGQIIQAKAEQTTGFESPEWPTAPMRLMDC